LQGGGKRSKPLGHGYFDRLSTSYADCTDFLKKVQALNHGNFERAQIAGRRGNVTNGNCGRGRKLVEYVYYLLLN
jgi:hypothetical protein